MEISHDASGQYLTDSINSRQLLYRTVFQLFPAPGKRTAEHFGIGKTDSRNPKAVDQPDQCGISGHFNAFQQLFTGLLAKSFQFPDTLPVFLKFKNIRKLMNKAHADELFQRCL